MAVWHKQRAGVRRLVPALGLLIIMLPLCSCGGTASSAPLVQTESDLSATLEITPDPPPVMQDTTLLLTLRDADGNLVSGASVMFDLTMPAMEMPENQPTATEEEDGIYRADTVFTMSGEWQIDAEVTVEETREVFTFLIDIK
jgi:hypothetical protein